MANETLFKVYNTGETVLVGNLAAIVPAHNHDGRYLTEEELTDGYYDKEQSDERYYTKTESDTKLSDQYTKITEETDEKLANQYTKITTETDEKLEDYYTKTEAIDTFKGKTVSIALASANWLGNAPPFYQNINIPLATVNSKIDLQPTVQQIVDLQDEEVTLVTENDNGILKVWAIGYKPSKDYEIQATITEVATQ